MAHPELESSFSQEQLITAEQQKFLLRPEIIRQVGQQFFDLDERISQGQFINKEEVEQYLKETLSEYPELVPIFLDFIETYSDKSRVVKEYITRYQQQFSDNWPNKFFEDNFSQPPKGKIEVSIDGPIIYWRCYDLEDFILISGFDRKEAKKAFGSVRPPAWDQLTGLEGLNVAENAACIGYKPETEAGQRKSKLAQIHEKQHIKFSFSRRLHETLEGIESYSALELRNITPESSTEVIEQDIKAYFNFRFREALVGAKNEILAYLADGEKTPQEIKDLLLERGGIYDPAPLLDVDSFLDSYFKKRFGEEIIGRVDRNKLRSYGEELYSRYRKTIETIISSLEKTVLGDEKQRARIVNILSFSSLTQWPEITRTL